MASTVDEVFEAAGVVRLGAVPWRTRIPPRDAPSAQKSGVYVVARTPDPAAYTNGPATIDSAAIKQLLDVRPELLVDGRRPSPAALAERLESMWLVDETVLYIGQAGTSLHTRVGAYYRTPLGARSPHAGGWPIKCIRDLGATWVHFGECANAVDAERMMLETFMSAVTPESRAAVIDPALPLPYANLEYRDIERKRRLKRHGIQGAKAR